MWAKIFYGAMFLIIAASYLFTQSLIGDNYILFTNIIYQVPLLVALVVVGNLTRAYGLSSPHGLSFGLITLGLVVWLGAEFLWVIYESVLQVEVIYPSPADFLYLASYVFLFLGFTNEWKIGGSRFPLWLCWVLCLVVLIMMGLMFNAVYDETATDMANMVSLAYSVADVLVLISAIFALFNARQYEGGRLYGAWFFVFIGSVATLVGDILVLVFMDAYGEGLFLARQINLLWIVTFVAFGYAFTSINNIIKDIGSRVVAKTS